MKRILLATALTFTAVSSLVHSEIDKSKFCPNVNEIKITLSKPWHYILSAYNGDGKTFSSNEIKYDSNNGPVAPLYFVNVNYEPRIKKLSCIYYAFHMYEIHPTLVNIGDY